MMPPKSVFIKSLSRFFLRNNHLQISDQSYLFKPTLPPQHENSIIYVKAAPPIRNLVFSGGGAKGAAYPGVFRALEQTYGNDNTPFRAQIHHVAGSSIGGIAAAFFACGMRSHVFKHIMSSYEFGTLKGERSGIFHHDGKPMLDLLESSISSTVLQYSRASTFLHANPTAASLTFLQLKTLASVDPAHFKELNLTAYCLENDKTYVFNAENTPNLPISLACRASASLPVLFKPVEIDQAYLHEGRSGHLTFIDGGYHHNVPVDIMQYKQQNLRYENLTETNINLQTLVFVFDETNTKQRKDGQSLFHNANTTHAAHIYKPSLFDRFMRNKLPRYVHDISRSTITNTTAKMLGLANIQKNYTQRSIPIYVSGVKTRDFHKIKSNLDTLCNEGEALTKAYLTNHRGEAFYHTFSSPSDLVEFLPENERLIVCQQLEMQYTTDDANISVDMQPKSVRF